MSQTLRDEFAAAVIMAAYDHLRNYAYTDEVDAIVRLSCEHWPKGSPSHWRHKTFQDIVVRVVHQSDGSIYMHTVPDAEEVL